MALRGKGFRARPARPTGENLRSKNLVSVRGYRHPRSRTGEGLARISMCTLWRQGRSLERSYGDRAAMARSELPWYKAATMPRRDLSLRDLPRSPKGASKLMNVKVPARMSKRIERFARELGASKRDMMITLLNEGLGKVSQRGLAARKPSVRSHRPVAHRPSPEDVKDIVTFFVRTYQGT
jgi:hypothetical protein